MLTRVHNKMYLNSSTWILFVFFQYFKVAIAISECWLNKNLFIATENTQQSFICSLMGKFNKYYWKIIPVIKLSFEPIQFCSETKRKLRIFKSSLICGVLSFDWINVFNQWSDPPFICYFHWSSKRVPFKSIFFRISSIFRMVFPWLFFPFQFFPWQFCPWQFF